MRPPGLADKRFASLYLFAACRPGTDEAFALALPEAAAASMAVFLARFAQQLEPGVHAAVILDQAGWHVSRRLTVPDNITLISLPAYSPELNPVERVWLYLRERFLSHRVLDGYTAEQAQAYKPRLRAFEYMFDQLGCAPEDVLHVSASLRYDLMSAHDLGIEHKVYVNRGFEPSTPYYGYAEIRDLSGLPGVLGL